jgi:adenylate cyclase
VRVLIVDDNADSRQLVKDIMMSMGHEALTAADGPTALSIAQTETPDMIIMDVNMPGMTGFVVSKQLKAETATAHIPILLLTALADVENRVHGLEIAGADDYLTKPFSPRELAARVEKRLRIKSEADDLRQTREMVRQTFERFVHPSVVEQLLQDPSQVKLGGKLQEITVLFTDLEGFTAFSEQTDPEKLLSVLNSYHALVVKIIQQFGGTVDKFIGDGVMALYNTPLPMENHALAAVQTAICIRNEVADFHQQLDPAYRMNINFGIHTGAAVVGNVGATNIMQFSAVGDTVNLAARLQGLSKNNQVLISEATYRQTAEALKVNLIGNQNVKGRQESVMVYEVLEIAS